VVSLRSTTAAREGKRGRNDLIDIGLSPKPTRGRIRGRESISGEAGGWGRMLQGRGPWTCRRLSCGVAALHHSHPRRQKGSERLD